MLPVMTPAEHASILHTLHGEQIAWAGGHISTVQLSVPRSVAMLTVARFDDHAPASVEPNIVVGDLLRTAVAFSLVAGVLHQQVRAGELPSHAEIAGSRAGGFTRWICSIA